MAEAHENSLIRILSTSGAPVGAGFLVSPAQAMTCAHMVKILGAGANASTNIATLQVDNVPAGAFPLRMGRSSESRLGNELYAFGYAFAAGEQRIGGLGTFITLKQEGNFICCNETWLAPCKSMVGKL